MEDFPEGQWALLHRNAKDVEQSGTNKDAFPLGTSDSCHVKLQLPNISQRPTQHPICSYVYILIYMHTYPRLCHFVLKLMSWSLVDRLVTAGVALRDLSSAFTCPIHCGQSIFFPFLSGFSLGLLLGFLSALLLGFYLLRPSLPGAVAFPDLGLRRSVHPRLRAYCE